MANPSPRALLPLAVVSVLAASGAGRGVAQGGSPEDAGLVLAVASAGEADAEGERLGPVRQGRLRSGQARRWSLRLPAGACVLWVARGGAGLANLDVRILRGRAALARDTATGPAAEARHCAGERAETLRLEVKAFRGAGRFAAAAYRVEAGAEATEEVAGTSPLARLGVLVERHGGDTIPVTPPRVEQLEEGAPLGRAVPLAPGRCYRVFAAGGPGVGRLALALEGPSGARIQAATPDHATPTLGVLRPLCPARPGRYRVQLVAAAGRGSVAWRVFGTPVREAAAQEERAEVHPVGGRGRGYVPERIRQRHRQVGEGALAVTDVLEGTLRRSQVARHEVEVRAGRCYVVIAAAVPSAQRMSVRVVDPFGLEQAESEPDPIPHTRVCPNASGTWRIELKMELGYGAYGLQVFEGG